MDEFLEELFEITDKKIKALEKYLYTTVLEYFMDNLDIDENKVKFTNKNIGAINNLDSINDSFTGRLKSLTKYVLDSIKTIVEITGTQLSEYNPRAVAASEKVQETILNHAKKSMEINTNLSTVYAEIKQESLSVMSRLEGASLAELRDILKDRIQNKKIISKYFNTWTTDIYSQYQRASANEIRKDIGLKYAIYQGGLIETSRKFCIDRNNKVFSEEEIKSWANLEWQGKPDSGYNPFIDCGGYNCRHRLDWVSDSFAELYKQRQK